MNRYVGTHVCAAIVMLSLVTIGPIVIPSGASAEEQALDLNSPDIIRQTLEQQLGKRVKVKLESGQDMEGKVAKVGTHALQLIELTGMEFFEATIKLDDVAAVIVRVHRK